MICRAAVLICDNEHGSGDVVFPDLTRLEGFELSQHFAQAWTAAELRRRAKEQGWGRADGVDYCPACLESMRS